MHTGGMEIPLILLLLPILMMVVSCEQNNDRYIRQSYYIDNNSYVYLCPILNTGDKAEIVVKIGNKEGKCEISWGESPYYYFEIPPYIYDVYEDTIVVMYEMTHTPWTNDTMEVGFIEQLDVKGCGKYFVKGEVDIISSMLAAYSLETAGTVTINGTYKEKAFSFDVTVQAKSVTDVTLKSAPTKTEYTFFEDAYDLTGAKLTIAYSDATSEDIDVTAEMLDLTAFNIHTPNTYKIDGTYSGYEFTFNFVVAEPESKTVTEVLALEANTESVVVKGVIVGVVYDGNKDNEPRYGVEIMDKVTGNCVLVNGFTKMVDGAETNCLFNEYYDSYDSTKQLVPGQEIVVAGDFQYRYSYVGSTAYWNAVNASKVKVVADSVAIDFAALTNVTTVTNNAEFASALGGSQALGKVVKIVATEENPLFLGCSSTTISGYNTIFYMNGSAAGKSDMNIGSPARMVACAAKTSSNSTGIKTSNLYKDLYCFSANATEKVDTSTVGTQVKAKGTIYLVVALSSGSYTHVVPLNSANWSLEAITE